MQRCLAVARRFGALRKLTEIKAVGGLGGFEKLEPAETVFSSRGLLDSERLFKALNLDELKTKHREQLEAALADIVDATNAKIIDLTSAATSLRVQMLELQVMHSFRQPPAT